LAIAKEAGAALRRLRAISRMSEKGKGAMTKFYQCSLKEVGGSRETVGWIEERGAKLGAHVELKEFGDGVFFEVMGVSSFAMEGEELRQKQKSDRNPFASIPPR
jgi:hypothetical protein